MSKRGKQKKYSKELKLEAIHAFPRRLFFAFYPNYIIKGKYYYSFETTELQDKINELAREAGSFDGVE